MKKKLIYITLFLLVINIWSNSIFSFTGMPITYYGNDVYGCGMGETGMGDIFRINTNYNNPANIITADKVIFATAITMGYQWYSDNYTGYRDNNFNFPYFTIAVPYNNHKFAFSYNSYMSGNLETEKKIITANLSTDYDYTEIHKINSNIYKVSLLYAFKNKYLNIGISGNYYFGHKIRLYELDFVSSVMNDAKYEMERTFKSAGYSLGISKKIKNISFGISYQAKTQLNGDIIKRFNFTPGTDTLSTEENQFELPDILSTAITLKLIDKIKINFDSHYEFWENTLFYDNNSYKYGFGIAYEPLSGYGHWYERIPLRAGSFVRTLPFKKNSQEIIEKGLTFGFSIPLKSPGKNLDLAIVYLLRGEIEKHEIRDKTLELSIGINGFDIFSKRYKKIGHRDIPKADNQVN